jgi:hypothetical protein
MGDYARWPFTGSATLSSGGAGAGRGGDKPAFPCHVPQSGKRAISHLRGCPHQTERRRHVSTDSRAISNHASIKLAAGENETMMYVLTFIFFAFFSFVYLRLGCRVKSRGYILIAIGSFIMAVAFLLFGYGIAILAVILVIAGYLVGQFGLGIIIAKENATDRFLRKNTNFFQRMIGKIPPETMAAFKEA